MVSILSKKNFRRFVGGRLRREAMSRRQSGKNMKPIIIKKRNFEDISMRGLADSSSEGSLESVMCYVAQDESTTQEQPWNKEDIQIALTHLPGGETALSLIPFLYYEALQETLEEFQCLTINKNENRVPLPMFADECMQKTVLANENRAAAAATPGQLLAGWPDTCLLVASWLGHVEIVKALLDKGASVCMSDNNGRTPLHLAACATSTKVVEELLKHDADPCKWDFAKKCTPLHCAVAAGCPATVKCLIESGADVDANRSPLYYAVVNNAVDCVEALLQAGACPNNPQIYTKMPLHVAASLGNVHCTKLLLNHGADVTMKMGVMKSTPLHLAAAEGSAECTRLLLLAGSKTETRNSRGQTAMHLATLAQSVETIDILISFGANVDAEDNEGRTPLHAAAASARKSSELVKILIQAGASVNKADKFGYTPLHITALNESSRTVMMLLSKSGDVTARTKGGATALSFIIRRTPDVLPQLVTRLDQAISLQDHELGDVDCELRVNFRPLVPGRNETDLILCLLEVGQGHMLKHPLCESFLYLKWKRIRKFFLFSLIFHLIFVAFFTGFICVTYLSYNEQQSNVFFWLVTGFTCILASKEIFQITYGICYYTKHWENWLQWSVIVAACIILVAPIHEWQYHVAAVGILLVWIELMIVIGRFPMFGIYVQMFTRVSINFFKFLVAYICLIIGFSLSFTVLHNEYESFANPLISLLKVVIMMSVILTNLMVGLAVSDIQELRRCASLDRLVRHAEVMIRFENMLFSKLLDCTPACKIIQVFRKNTLLLRPPHHCALNIRPNDPREKRLPRELIQSLYRLASEQKMRRMSFCSDISSPENDQEITVNEPNHRRLSRMNSKNDSNQQQLNELVAELKQCSYDINIKLDNFMNKIESVVQNTDLTMNLY